MAPGISNAKNVAIAGWDLIYYSNNAKEKGIKLTISKWRRPAICAPVKEIGLYMICIFSALLRKI